MTTDNSVCRQLLCRLPACQIIISSSIYHLAGETGPATCVNYKKLKLVHLWQPKRGTRKEKPPKMPNENEREREKDTKEEPRSAAGTCGLKLSCI